jgi:hypothetical protein
MTVLHAEYYILSYYSLNKIIVLYQYLACSKRNDHTYTQSHLSLIWKLFIYDL